MRVLLVDDDPEMLLITSFSLEKVGGATVACVSTPAEAITLAGREPFDVVLLDYLMPGATAADVMPAIIAIAPTLPIIILTAKTDIDLIRALVACGARGVLRKPFDPQTLFAEIKRLL